MSDGGVLSSLHYFPVCVCVCVCKLVCIYLSVCAHHFFCPTVFVPFFPFPTCSCLILPLLSQTHKDQSSLKFLCVIIHFWSCCCKKRYANQKRATAQSLRTDGSCHAAFNHRCYLLKCKYRSVLFLFFFIHVQVFLFYEATSISMLQFPHEMSPRVSELLKSIKNCA